MAGRLLPRPWLLSRSPHRWISGPRPAPPPRGNQPTILPRPRTPSRSLHRWISGPQARRRVARSLLSLIPRAATLPLQGAPRPLAWQPVHRTGSSTICLLFQPKPLAVALLSTPSPRLRTTARLSPRVRVRPPASPDPPPSAHGLPRGSPAPDASTRAQPASASKPKTKKARRRKARPPGGQATEDLEAHALAWIAEAEADAEAQILEAASDGEEWA